MLITSQRAVAHLLVDGEQTLKHAGGDLDHYGLADLRHQHSACEQLPFLEGLLPLPETPFLLRSMGMPSGRVADVHLFAAEDATWVVLLDVTAEHDEARKIQQKAYDMTLLSQREARLLAKLETAHQELTLAHRELTESRETLLLTHNRLQRELRDAERYVRAILPPPISEPFAIDWRFVPSTELGGDSFGYHWIDADHFALYLLDVCGHGVGASLLSVAVTNTLRSGALPHTDFRLPGGGSGFVEPAYQMEHHDGMYLTIWYGVYHRPTSSLRYASAGHPPPILVNGSARERGDARRLRARDQSWACCRRPAMSRGMHPRHSGPAVCLQRRRLRNSAGLTTACCRSRPSRRRSRGRFRTGSRNWMNSFVSHRTFTATRLLEDDFSILKMTI